MKLSTKFANALDTNNKRILAGASLAAILTLGYCVSTGGSSEVDCASLVSDVIEMSEDKDVKILEITSPEALYGGTGEIYCKGHAVWSDGDEGTIHYEVTVSPGGQSMIGYREG